MQRQPKNPKAKKLAYLALLLPVALAVAAGICILYDTATLTTDKAPASAASDKWASALDLSGVSNCHKVSADLYRGAQPTTEGMRQLERIGIKTIVNLRSLHSDRDELKGTHLAYRHIRMEAWDAEDDEVVRFLKIVTYPNNTPVFVHCKFGADRTGTMCAVYRIAVQNWSKQQAIEEMTLGPFGFHREWQNLVSYIRHLDVEKIKRRAGLKE